MTDVMRKGEGGGLVAEGELIEVIEISVEEVSSNKFFGRGSIKLDRFSNVGKITFFSKMV